MECAENRQHYLELTDLTSGTNIKGMFRCGRNYIIMKYKIWIGYILPMVWNQSVYLLLLSEKSPQMD